jgi:hypothetical protein
MSQLLSLNAIPSNGLALNNGVITISLGSAPSPAAQVGQLLRILGSASVPFTTDIWHANTAYPKFKYILDSSFNTWFAYANGGVSGSTSPFSAAGPGTLATDNVGSGYSSPPIQWVQVVTGLSWNFNGKYRLTAASGATLQVAAESEFAYFLPGTLQATGGGGQLAILIEPENILESYALLAGALTMATDVAYAQQSVYVLNLPSASATLTRLYNAQFNQNQLINPQQSKQYIRLIDCQSYYGADFDGLYSILSVISPSSCYVTPQFVQAVPNDYGGSGQCLFLATLEEAYPAGLMDVSPAAVASGAYVSDDVLLAINNNNKAAMIRLEVKDLGYWNQGSQIPEPVSTSPVDARPYDYDEVTFVAETYSSQAPFSNSPDVGFGSFTPGTLAAPPVNPGAGTTLLVQPYQQVIEADGDVVATAYDSGGTEDRGIVRAIAFCTRMSTPVLLPPQQLAPPAVIP